MAKFPQTDIDKILDDSLPLRLQNSDELQFFHTTAESTIYPFSIAHRAIELAAKPALENDWLEIAVDTGAKVYESIAATYPSIGTYDTVAARALVLASARRFLDSIKSEDDFVGGLQYARERIQADTPELASMVHEVSSRYVKDDAVALQFALGGAGAVRGMQIFVDKRLEAAGAMLDELEY